MRQFTDKLTIAIPVFERTDFFRSAVESVLNQSYSCDLIVVDNASSHTYFKDYCERNNIRYFRNASNIGMFPNWNRCFELCATEFLMVLGDDDLIENNFVETFLESIQLFPDIDIFFSDFWLLDNATGKTRNHSHTLPFGYISDGLTVVEYGLKFGLGFPIIASIIRKDKFNGFYTELHASNDWLWLYENARGLKFFGEQQKLLKYRSHSKQDHKRIDTHLNCMLSVAYIYGNIFRRVFAGDEGAQKLSQRKAKNVLLYLSSRADSKLLAEYRRAENIYARFFIEWVSSKWSHNLIFMLPLYLRRKLYSVCRRLSIFKPI